jgi:hypothetical protein
MAEEFPPVAPPYVRRWYQDGGRVRELLGGVERRFEEMGFLNSALVVGGGLLFADWVISPKGMSAAAKIWDKVSGAGGRHLPPPPAVIPPPGALPGARVGTYSFPFHPEMFENGGGEDMTGAEVEHPGWGFPEQAVGANLQAGWNQGAPPYGPWAVANPMRQYAHAAQFAHHHHGYSWE